MKGDRTVRGRVVFGFFSLFLLAMMLMPFLSTSADGVSRIKPEELKEMIERKDDILVVDNQPKKAYEQGHIKGAINFPWTSEIEEPGNLPKNKLLILYCACTHEEDSSDVATQLMKKFGYEKVKILEGGWIKWFKLGYPVEKGEGE